MAKKATKKQQVEEEELEYEEVEAKKGLEEIISENRYLVLGIAGAIALVILGFVGYRYLKASQNTEAQELMVEAPYFYERDSLAYAIDGQGEFMGFSEISEEFNGTKAADQANYYSGVISLRQGNPDAAIDYLNKVPTTNSMLDPMKYIALANAYAALGDFDASAKNFEKASKLPNETEHTTPHLLLKAGETYELAGNDSKALSLYQSIKKTYPEIAQTLQIEKYLARLGE